MLDLVKESLSTLSFNRRDPKIEMWSSPFYEVKVFVSLVCVILSIYNHHHSYYYILSSISSLIVIVIAYCCILIVIIIILFLRSSFCSCWQW